MKRTLFSRLPWPLGLCNRDSTSRKRLLSLLEINEHQFKPSTLLHLKSQSVSGSPSVIGVTIHYYTIPTISYSIVGAHVSNTLAITVFHGPVRRLQVDIQTTSMCPTAFWRYHCAFWIRFMRPEVGSYGRGYVIQWLIAVIYSRLIKWSLMCCTTDFVIIEL